MDIQSRLLFIGASLLVAIILSTKFAYALRITNKELKPYTWGYFTSVILMIHGSWNMADSVFAYSDLPNYGYGNQGYVLLAYMLLGILQIVGGYGWYSRNRILCILGIVVSLNPIYYLANTIYLKNRWSEMNRRPKAPIKLLNQMTPEEQSNWQESLNPEDDYSSKTNSDFKTTHQYANSKLTKQQIRRYAIGTFAVWIASAFLYFFLFNPYGSSVSSSEMEHFIKVLLFPGLVLLIAYLIYHHINKHR